MTEVLVNDGNHLIGVEVTAQTDGHVVGYIPGLVIVLDVGDGGVLQMLLCTQNGLCSVGVVGEKHAVDLFQHLAGVIGQGHVLLLIYGLQLGVESAYGGVLETVCLNLCPVFNLVAGDVLGIAGYIVAGVGICSVGSDGRHQLVVFVGDADL